MGLDIIEKLYKTMQHPQPQETVCADVENKLLITKEGEGCGMNWEIGNDIYTILYIK